MASSSTVIRSGQNTSGVDSNPHATPAPTVTPIRRNSQFFSRRLGQIRASTITT